jgi:hypothetical protein
MSYRPITDVWFLTRAKLKGGVKYYGAYLGGFPERARRLIGASVNDSVLHVCGGMARLYPYQGGFGPNDMTLDLNPETKPDFVADARDPFPMCPKTPKTSFWRDILIDPPYSQADAEKYTPGRLYYPSPNQLVRNAISVLIVGGKVGIIHYLLPDCPKNAKFVAAVGVLCGFNNRIRVFSVFEKLGPTDSPTVTGCELVTEHQIHEEGELNLTS